MDAQLAGLGEWTRQRRRRRPISIGFELPLLFAAIGEVSETTAASRVCYVGRDDWTAREAALHR
jgi:hypothetical protein